MLQSLMFTVNSVLPVFIVVIVGLILKKLNIITDSFNDTASKVVFNVALPLMLFSNVSTADLKQEFDLKLLIFTMAVTILAFCILWIISSFFIKNKQSLGAFVQGAFRSNFALIGVPLTMNILGQEAVAKTSIVLAFIIPVLNVLAVIILTATAENTQSRGLRKTFVNIMKNPLIIACLSGIPFSVFHIKLPLVMTNTINTLSDLATPLALLTIGSSLTLVGLKRTFLLSVTASFIKTAVIPAIFIPIALILGFKGTDIGILFIYLAAPTAVSSYIMARAMKSDDELSGNIVLISTFLSMITCFIGTFLLKNAGLLG